MSTIAGGEDAWDVPALGERQSLRQSVADSLRALVIAGRMRPGEIYSAPRLAAQFGVSATPVREAMLDLVMEGHIETVRNKGFRVLELSPRELDELAELRRLIEPPVMARIARRVPGSAELTGQVEALRAVAQEIVASASRGDLVQYIDRDLRFHLDFLALHGNDRLVQEVRALRRRSRLFGLESMSEKGTLVSLAREHEEMVDLALTGDAAGLEELTHQHIEHVRHEWAGVEQD